MLDQKDLSNIFQIIERSNFSGKEIDEVQKLKIKIINLLKTMPVVPEKEESSKGKASENA
jgi:hypothetical protein